MDITFNKTTEKNNNAIVWSVEVESVNLGYLEKTYENGSFFWIMTPDSRISNDERVLRSLRLQDTKISSLKQELRDRAENNKFSAKVCEYIYAQESALGRVEPEKPFSKARNIIEKSMERHLDLSQDSPSTDVLQRLQESFEETRNSYAKIYGESTKGTPERAYYEGYYNAMQYVLRKVQDVQNPEQAQTMKEVFEAFQITEHEEFVS